ncbi:hypothetical protein ALC57_10469 [Trachymyrmex cornetzi]|uniref:Uncharacterized protein n=1 Tax=Trachymyrmex cornetzi TaxID=471704 RepID=A0A195DXB3_9HYME|nr:hypothetical protein ALC57_10469 [Trachymyrmex cornetzi]
MRRNKAKKQDSVETDRDVAEPKNYTKKKKKKLKTKFLNRDALDIRKVSSICLARIQFQFALVFTDFKDGREKELVQQLVQAQWKLSPSEMILQYHLIDQHPSKNFIKFLIINLNIIKYINTPFVECDGNSCHEIGTPAQIILYLQPSTRQEMV